jgi:hypothetical protein
MTPLREITDPVDLCRPDGRLNPDAVGWSRQPQHRANLTGRGRTKRWEYWAITTPTMVFAITVSDLDYAALHSVYLLDADGVETASTALVPLSRVPLADRAVGGAVRIRAKGLAVDVEHDSSGAWLSAVTPELAADFRVDRPAGHESLGVVVPWSDRLFQYTVKENTLPARGVVRVGGRTLAFDGDCWATLDHGRGRWPYAITWNWGAGSGRVGDRTVGIQVGGAWTEGTGSTENAVCVDGIVSHIDEELVWAYDSDDWMAPWRVTAPRTGRVDLRLSPRHVRVDRTSLLVLANDTHQAFGTWSGTMVDDDGRVVPCDGLTGWAEEVRNRW